jgi:hypothetical protein
MRQLHVARVAAVLPGYATVGRASEVLHLAPRSVRDLIYSGRLPSLRIGRPHFVRAADLEIERRRRLGPRLPSARRASTRDRSQRPPSERRHVDPELRRHVDPELRRQRAAERSALVSRWAERHEPAGPSVPFAVSLASSPATCTSCNREIRTGARLIQALPDTAPLCLRCGRRSLLAWSDRRRLEAATARQMAHDLGARAADTSTPPATRAA